MVDDKRINILGDIFDVSSKIVALADMFDACVEKPDELQLSSRGVHGMANLLRELSETLEIIHGQIERWQWDEPGKMM